MAISPWLVLQGIPSCPRHRFLPGWALVFTSQPGVHMGREGLSVRTPRGGMFLRRTYRSAGALGELVSGHRRGGRHICMRPAAGVPPASSSLGLLLRVGPGHRRFRRRAGPRSHMPDVVRWSHRGGAGLLDPAAGLAMACEDRREGLLDPGDPHADDATSGQPVAAHRCLLGADGTGSESVHRRADFQRPVGVRGDFLVQDANRVVGGHEPLAGLRRTMSRDGRPRQHAKERRR